VDAATDYHRGGLDPIRLPVEDERGGLAGVQRREVLDARAEVVDVDDDDALRTVASDERPRELQSHLAPPLWPRRTRRVFEHARNIHLGVRGRLLRSCLCRDVRDRSMRSMPFLDTMPLAAPQSALEG
jgi:hypothetical protein